MKALKIIFRVLCIILTVMLSPIVLFLEFTEWVFFKIMLLRNTLLIKYQAHKYKKLYRKAVDMSIKDIDAMIMDIEMIKNIESTNGKETDKH